MEPTRDDAAKKITREVAANEIARRYQEFVDTFEGLDQRSCRSELGRWKLGKHKTNSSNSLLLYWRLSARMREQVAGPQKRPPVVQSLRHMTRLR